MSRCPSEPIAIVGSACRFAGGANSPSTLWDILEETPDLLQKIGFSRFNSDGFYHQNADHHGHTNVRHAYLINENVAEFDAEFFGVKPVEAKAMDPQQRFLLEVTYEAIESAGMEISNLRGSNTGAYVGVMFNDYATMLLRDHQTIPRYFATGTGQSMLSNRISYFYDWHGPSITIDTACSSSLVAAHMAVQSLRSGECRVALACGSNLLIGPEPFIIESKLNMLSPDGRSRMWDQGANGYARGDGVAAIVLKTLSAALEDGDHIESVIRETGLNQDGATASITIPSASAQVSLIRNTYGKAGLDLLNPKDRPQYFEAHGTGTPAGDPIEAEAIHTAFFTSKSGDVFHEPTTLGMGHPLYVGSIKTILGHTEGAAGVAGLIKASLALQRGCIPPNLLFNELNPNVAPFYKNVEILRTKKLWPTTEKGEVRRASVNSFGFGGTNAHAIVESYETSSTGNSLLAAPPLPSKSLSTPLFTPFVFSAFSELSLRGILSSYLHYLEGNVSDVKPQDLAWTLRQRRSEFQYRASFAALSLEDLRGLIKSKLEKTEINRDLVVGIKSLSSGTRQSKKVGGILGVFTGQGAQHPRMGASLIEESPAARKRIQDLEDYLTQIPEEDRPSWSLVEELLAYSSSSRVQEAELSQPLCTALQILLVDLLRLAGVHFSAVIGHSSGEIAAAYAAGYLSARDAMWIAHYRGRLASLAVNRNRPDIKGAMLAVGSSMEDMDSLCADERFVGRVAVAASNSSSSVTVSGDADAIAELEDVLIDEDKFNRRLKVDKAYHSHHMLSCYEPYVGALQNLDIKPELPASAEACVWFSSVDGGQVLDPKERLQGLGSEYWAENFTRPVLFSQALSTALKNSSFSLALEVGPHPALKGPATETIREVLGKDIPYHGVFSRKLSATQAFSDALGFLWSHLGKNVIDLDGFERAVSSHDDTEHPFRLVKGLPTYQWNHKTRYWHEARWSRKTRLRASPVHALLGDETPDSAPYHMRWRNLLRVSELEWLSGHAVQGQTVFPAAGYLATAMDAAQIIAGESTMRLVEMSDFLIHQAIPFDQDDAGIEVLIEMSDITRDKHDSNLIRTNFTYAAAIDVGSDNLTLAASSKVEIRLGEASASLLPQRGAEPPHMIEVEPERFYSALDELGYNFTGYFKSLTSMKRKRGWATALVQTQMSDPSLLIHPATLDAVLQSAFLAYSYPYDEELRTLHLPTTIRRIRINPAALQDGLSGEVGEKCFALADASIDFGRLGQKTARNIVATINFYAGSQTTTPPHAAVQVRGVSFLPLGDSVNGEVNRPVYSKEYWVPCEPDGVAAARGLWEDAEVRRKARLLERVATFYLRRFHREVPENHPARTTFPTNWYLNHARHVYDLVESRKHAWWEAQWDQDTVESISDACQPHMDLPDFQIMHLVGTQMPNVFEGKTTMLQQFRHDGSDILDRYYAEGTITKHLAAWVARVVKQIVDRHPHLRILEVGAGTGGATKAILDEIGDKFSSYTYTDISSAFFETASNFFSKYKNKMTFKTLDIETDPTLQGFKEGAYDLVIAFFVIHATGDLDRSLHNLRKLIRPGGFLAMGEGADNGAGTATSGFIFGTLPGWWVGTSKGRVLSPLISVNEWDGLLRSSGFSGIESSTSNFAEDIFNVFPVVSQAIDPRVNFLRDPLSSITSLVHAGVSPIKRLILVGGQSARSLHLIDGLEALMMQGYAIKTYRFRNVEEVDYSLANDESTVVSLTDLDSPIFKDITPQRFHALQKMFEVGKTALWVTSGRQSSEPFANMMVAFARCAGHEISGLDVQKLDVSKPEEMNPKALAEVLLRLHGSLALKKENRTGGDLFWTVEPELVIDDQNRLLVPRLNFIAELNDRYNAGRRPTKIQPSSAEVAPVFSLQYETSLGSSSNYVLRELTRYELELLDAYKPSNGWLEIRTLYSTISAIKTSFGRRYIVAGVEVDTEHSYIALASSRSSIIRIPHGQVIRSNIEGLSLKETLSVVTAHIIALTAFHSLSSGHTLLAHNVPLPVADALAAQSDEKKIDVVYVTDRADISPPTSWITLPKYLGSSEIKDILALDEPPAAFLGLTNHETTSYDSEVATISSFEAPGAIILTAKSLFSSTADITSNTSECIRMTETIRNAFAHAKKQWSAESQTANHSASSLLPVVALEHLVQTPTDPLDPLSIVDWTGKVSTLPILATRLDASLMFKGDSTYWIVGMSGALGISLADWMISRGVRNLVMTSRNPDIDPEWIAAHKRRKAIVTIMRCDVTDEAALKAAHRKICETLPTIKGVIHGAMVLRDVAISNMSYEQLMDVIRPKVNGSIYLDRIFAEKGLDFLVFTSSINTIIGNKGQANYGAANSFMCSLAAQRQKRGLQTAAVNGGAIIGAGYMERDSRRTWDRITQNNWMMRMSEDDFVQSVCEGIEASRLDSHGPEITTGLSLVPAHATNAPFWLSDPKFSYFITDEQESSEYHNRNGTEATSNATSVQDLLLLCKTEQECFETVQHAFTNMLRNVLQVTISDDDLMASHSSDIGLDSLVSVNIRSWFLKQMQVGVPVLKIMSNETMADLLQFAISAVPRELVPQLNDQPEPAETTVVVSQQQFISNGSADPISLTNVQDKGNLNGYTKGYANGDDSVVAPSTNGQPSWKTHQGMNEVTATNKDNAINWEVESRPPTSIMNVPSDFESPTSVVPPRIVVLTGAGGLFGRHLVKYLSMQPSVQKIICIALRNLAQHLEKDELPPPSEVIEYYEGDLRSPLLGLTPAQAAAVFSGADVVIHNGADTSHMKRYQDLWTSNVGSTIELVKLCLPRRVPFHYVSSAGLAMLYDQAAFPPVSVMGSGCRLPATDGSFGYASAKWTCEALLERTHALYKGKWPVCIHRPSTIIREGMDAEGLKAELDWVNALLFYAAKTKTVPQIQRNRGALDLVSVQNACSDLVSRVVQPDERMKKGEISFVHQVGDRIIFLNRLQDMGLEEPSQKPFQVLPLDQWIDKAKAEGLHPAVSALVEMMDDPDLPDYPRLLKQIA
ncbi:putative polyketide synthase [Truncatella angustata]|uniref:Polyketide synthase n=1 Tax=Truncatella angustata TaxID=152316 RepID=A0A9P8ZVV6_9PEZI|nr:putative polyketide synthase [Truncatella angustata]KAH6652395.1 putative polyketide synthase [Truncatella angustata]